MSFLFEADMGEVIQNRQEVTIPIAPKLMEILQGALAWKTREMDYVCPNIAARYNKTNAIGKNVGNNLVNIDMLRVIRWIGLEPSVAVPGRDKKVTSTASIRCGIRLPRFVPKPECRRQQLFPSSEPILKSSTNTIRTSGMKSSGRPSPQSPENSAANQPSNASMRLLNIAGAGMYIRKFHSLFHFSETFG